MRNHWNISYLSGSVNIFRQLTCQELNASSPELHTIFNHKVGNSLHAPFNTYEKRFATISSSAGVKDTEESPEPVTKWLFSKASISDRNWDGTENGLSGSYSSLEKLMKW
jgi:AraC-like DNA-binding protein